jgi:hypothetical protein
VPRINLHPYLGGNQHLSDRLLGLASPARFVVQSNSRRLEFGSSEGQSASDRSER